VDRAESRDHMSAERFDKPLADLFDMQDEIVAHLAAQSGTQLVEAQARRAERSPEPDSMDLYFGGMSCIHKGMTAEHLAQADGFLERGGARPEQHRRSGRQSSGRHHFCRQLPDR